jgi:putative PEP-CTERM system TPR-repeat lipoprotein
MRTGLGLSRLASGDFESATADLQFASELDETKSHADVLLISSYLQRRQFAEALKAAQTLQSKQPENPLSYNLLAAAYIGNQDIPAARRALEKALALQPGYTPAALTLAQFDLRDGNKAAARKRFEDILAKDRSNVQAYIALASMGPRIDARPSEIQGWLEAARRESPGTIQPLVMLARFHVQAGEPKKALELVEKAVIQAPDNSEVLELAGQVQLAAGERIRALAMFSKWVSLQPSSPQALYRLATAQLANGDPTGAVSSLRKALEQRPRFLEAQTLLAETLIAAGRHADVLPLAEQMQRQSPKAASGWMVQGDSLFASKQYTQAAKAYEDALERRPSGPLIMKLHAALAQAGRAAAGETRLKDWIKAQPADLATQLYLAEVYLKSRRYGEAIAAYEAFLRVAPESIVALNNLAWCYQQLNDKRAVPTAEKAMSLSPQNPAVMDTLGWILAQNGDFPRSIDLLKRATAMAPKSADIRYHYVQSLAKSGDRETAKAELERLLVEHPKFPDHDEALGLLAQLRK